MKRDGVGDRVGKIPAAGDEARLKAAAASRLAEEASALQYTRMSTEIVEADRHLLKDGELPAWQALMS